jgi:hypothetical protein
MDLMASTSRPAALELASSEVVRSLLAERTLGLPR